jgi:hypothetical protein
MKVRELVKSEGIGIGVIGTGFAKRTELPAFRLCPGR